MKIKKIFLKNYQTRKVQIYITFSRWSEDSTTGNFLHAVITTMDSMGPQEGIKLFMWIYYM
jgi:hypothetical protein